MKSKILNRKHFGIFFIFVRSFEDDYFVKERFFFFILLTIHTRGYIKRRNRVLLKKKRNMFQSLIDRKNENKLRLFYCSLNVI